MQIDWLTVAAQVVNFLVLVLLLQRFLYGPIVRLMDQRERNIESRYQEAEQKVQAAEHRETLYREKLNELEDRKAALIAEVKEETARQRASSLEEVRTEVKDLAQRWRSEVEREREAFLMRLRQEVARQAVAVTRKVLADLAGADLQERMVEKFLDRLSASVDTQKHALVASTDRSISVASSLELTPSLQRRIRDFVHREIAPGLEVSFRTGSDMTCGVALVAGGHKLQWTVDAYLDDIQSALTDALKTSDSDADR